MKKLLFLLSVTAAVLSVAGGAAYAEQPEKVIRNNFINDFMYYSQHPDEYCEGNWSYCYGDIETYFDMSFFAPQKGWMGSESYCEIRNAVVHPGTNEMVLVIWTSPHKGTVSFDALAQKLYHGNGDGAAIEIYNNAKELLFQAEMPLGDGGEKAYSDEFAVKKGEKIYFVLDYVGNNWTDSTRFDIQIELFDIELSAPVSEEERGCSSNAYGYTGLLAVIAMAAAAIKSRKKD